MKKRKLPGLPKLSKPGQPPKQGGAAAKGRKLPKLPFPPWLLASCAAMLALGWLAQNLWLPQGWELGTPSAAHTTTEVLPVSGVVISEVMSSNKAAWAGPQGLYPDWVELTNQGDQAVDISGWTLTDSPDSKVRFSFDSQVLQPGQCLLVYMTGNLQTAPDAPYEAPCKLSASGDALLLYDASGSIMQAMNLPALAGDTAYALEGASGDYIATTLYTPGLANTRSNHAALTTQTAASPVAINEVMAVNQSTLQDGDGDFSDWLELYNAGSQAVDLTGYGLSDDPADLLRWRFPQTTLEPGQYLIVFLSGKESREGELHAGFKLAAEGESLCFSDASGRLIQQVEFDILKADQAWARDANGAYALATPTPGRANP